MSCKVKFRHAHLSGNYRSPISSDPLDFGRLDLNLVADRAILRSLLRHVGLEKSEKEGKSRLIATKVTVRSPRPAC